VNPPDGFGTSNVVWTPDPTHAVAKVAALWLQHHVVLAAYNARPGLSLRERGSLVGISRTQLGRMMSGQRVMDLTELLAFACAHGLDVTTRLGPDQLLPPAYDNLIRGLDPGGMPRLGPDDAIAALGRTIRDLCNWWLSEARASRESLLSAPVLLHRAVVLAESPHLPAATATQLDGDKQGARVTYAVREPRGVRLVFLPDPETQNADRASELVLTWLLDPPLPDWHSDKVEPIILLAGPLAAAQLRRHGGTLDQGSRLLYRGHDLQGTREQPPEDRAFRVEELIQLDQYAGVLLIPD
jgi:hypothetical protein